MGEGKSLASEQDERKPEQECTVYEEVNRQTWGRRNEEEAR